VKLGNIYNQTNVAANCATTLSAIVVDIVKNFQNNKIKIRISKLKKGSTIYIGAI
jgi:hypothetical protein